MTKIRPHGYLTDLLPDPNYKKKGLHCEYEHCIEEMPSFDHLICPVFNCVCPGGVEKVAKCRRKINRKKVQTEIKKDIKN